MIFFNRMTDYGIMIMVHLAANPDHAHKSQEIVRKIPVAQAAVRKLLTILTQNGLLVSHRGPNGGYQLALPPEEITIHQMITALEGAVAMTHCTSHHSTCTLLPSCSISHHWQRINGQVQDLLAGITLDQMSKGLERKLQT
ncbi:MAG: SUF system Fe-S cluster assembly regulator [Magnetococcales bacterium]|nr:SUF system Fe-S cluster assembly regulator [Magnetococcales bacterium]